MSYTLIYLFWSIYLVYMLNWFKTTWNFAHSLSDFSSEFLAHPVTKLSNPVNPVCKLGNTLSWIGAAGMIFRGLSLDFLESADINLNSDLYINFLAFNLIYPLFLALGFFLSLTNFNVTVYLLPILMFELYILNTNQIINPTSK